MNKLVCIILAGGAAVILPAVANAQEDTKAQKPGGWYVSASATVSILNDTDGTVANAPMPGSTVRTQNPLETGFGGQIALGRAFGPVRLEGEFGYTRNKQDRYVAIVPPTGAIPADVKDDAIRGMVNGYYDFSYGRFQPYVGAGAGVARINIDFFAPRAPFPSEPPRQLIKNGETRFAYQLISGVAVPVGEKAALTLQYRWFDAGTVKTNDERGQETTRNHAGHNVDLGLRVRF
jgi:opacity protein-like surface antigen